MKTKTQFMNRILSLVLSIMMVVSMLPASALSVFAADTTYPYAVVDTEAGTVTIDGTLGGKTDAAEEDLTALVAALKSYVESGHTTIIVTGSQPALLLKDGYLIPVVSLAFEQLTYAYQDENIDSYWGAVDLIYQDVTEIVEYEFYVCDVLKSITLPKVTTVGDRGFWACYYLETLTFGSVVTTINDNNGEVFYDLGYEIDGCNLVLNCGQLQAATEYQPNLTTKTWWKDNEWKSITLGAHVSGSDGTCDCGASVVAEVEYGDTATYYATLTDALVSALYGTDANVYALTDCNDDFTIPASVSFYGGDNSFGGNVTNNGDIREGTFNGEVTNEDFILGGTFNATVINHEIINGGTFNGNVTNYDRIYNDFDADRFILGDDFTIENHGTISCDYHHWKDGVCRLCAYACTHAEGTAATCTTQAVCENCGASYGEVGGHTPGENADYTDNGNGEHSYTCTVCGTTVTEDHTLDVTTGVCTKCGADASIATVTDGTNTYYAADAATLNQAVTAILETGSRTFTVELPADTEAGMITAIRRAICDTEGVADGSIHLTLKGVTSIPGTTNWDGVAFGPRNAQWDENNVEIVSHEEVTQLASVNLPNVTEIGAQAFLDCSNLTSITAPKVQFIGDWGLQGTAITSIDMPLLKEAGYSAFCRTALTEVSLPSLETAGVIVFGHCEQLRTVDLPKLQNLSQQLFTRCTSLVSVSAPAATSMGINVFKGCSELVSITLPGVTELTNEAFAECTKLENITLGSVITKVNVNLFAGEALSSGITLTLNCGQENAETLPAAAGTNVEWAGFTWKEVKFAHSYVNSKCTACGEDCTHTGGTATCTTQAVCESCGVSYGEVDTTNHDETVAFSDNGFCPNGCYEPATLNAEGYYEIDNAGQLFWFANYINTVDRTANAVLTADIDLEGRPWTPIGSTGENSHNFRGVFDGQNHTIKGLYVEGGRAGLGFFGEVRTGTVKNFTIYGEVVANTDVNYVGGVIGSICGLNGENDLERNGAIIQNITSYVNLTAKTHGIGMIGGFVGYANHESLIENCSWYGTFDAGEYRVDSGAGGFIGKIQESTSRVTIRNCGAYGTIKTNYAKNSYNNTATIYMGGFLSFSNTGAQTAIENCLFAGKFECGENLTDEARLGAFGTLRSVNAIKNCYYVGDDGLEAVHSDSDLKPGENIEITSVTREQLKSGEVAYLLGEAWGQMSNTEGSLPIITDNELYKVVTVGETGNYSVANVGDTNSDGTVDVTDYQALVNKALADDHEQIETASYDDIVKYDIDGNGYINVLDASIMDRMINGHIIVEIYAVGDYDLNGKAFEEADIKAIKHAIENPEKLATYKKYASDINGDGKVSYDDLNTLTSMFPLYFVGEE